MKKFNFRNFFGFDQKESNELNKVNQQPSENGSCGGSCSCDAPAPQAVVKSQPKSLDTGALAKKVNRRDALKFMRNTATAGAALASSSFSFGKEEKAERAGIKMDEYFKSNYRMMTDEERNATIERLERLSEIDHGVKPHIKGTQAQPNTLYGYAFNISKCQGYGDCIEACVKENNQDRKTNMQYIKIFEMENGHMNMEEGKSDYTHMVPAEGHFYLGTQCFQCANPPCTEVCPVKATWQEPDGIVVIDYDWCVGCRYCEAACPYWARRFNWNEPEVPAEEINPEQHYLGNRMRSKGTMEKCTFCISRTRDGLQPACAEACPTGARVFGNILDPDSEINYILKNKKVFRLKEDLGTEPKFWYYMD